MPHSVDNEDQCTGPLHDAFLSAGTRGGNVSSHMWRWYMKNVAWLLNCRKINGIIPPDLCTKCVAVCSCSRSYYGTQHNSRWRTIWRQNWDKIIQISDFCNHVFHPQSRNTTHRNCSEICLFRGEFLPRDDLCTSAIILSVFEYTHRLNDKLIK